MKNMFLTYGNRINLLLPLKAKLPNKTKKSALVIAKCSMLMTVR